LSVTNETKFTTYNLKTTGCCLVIQNNTVISQLFARAQFTPKPYLSWKPTESGGFTGPNSKRPVSGD